MGEVVPFNRAELQVVSEQEAARLLGVSRGTLGRMRRADIGPRPGRLSARRIGYRLAELTRWLASQESQSWAAAVAA